MKTQVLTFKNLLLLIGALLLNIATQRIQAQTVYFAENFDSAFTGTPAAPPGWTQTRIQAVTSAAAEFDWLQNVWLGTTWSNLGTGTTPATGAVNGTGVLWIDDYNLGGTSIAQTERRLELLTFLEENNIQTRVTFAGNVTRHPIYREYLQPFENADAIMKNGFLLGAHHGMGIEDVDYVCDKIKQFFSKNV